MSPPIWEGKASGEQRSRRCAIDASELPVVERLVLLELLLEVLGVDAPFLVDLDPALLEIFEEGLGVGDRVALEVELRPGAEGPTATKPTSSRLIVPVTSPVMAWPRPPAPSRPTARRPITPVMIAAIADTIAIGTVMSRKNRNRQPEDHGRRARRRLSAPRFPDRDQYDR